MTGRLVGQRVPRLEDRSLLTGKGRFVEDIRLPGTLEAAFLRSPHAHAEIRNIDFAAALALPGVRAVFTMSDLRPHLSNDRLVVALPSATIRQALDRPVLAHDEVCYVGEPIAIVVADDRYIAEDALALIDVEFNLLPAVVHCNDAVQDDAPKAHKNAPNNVVAEFNLQFGDVSAAFEGAAFVFGEMLHPERGGSHSLECRGVVAQFDVATGQLTVWSSTQTPHAALRLISSLLKMDEGSIRVITPDVGGGFGPKLVFYSEEVVTAFAALRVGCPVKWIEDRREHFLSATQERDQYWDVEIAVDGDGRVRGVRGGMVHDHGAYTARGVNVAFEAAQALTMPYDIPACDLSVRLAVTNKVPVTAVRGAGQPQGVFVMERLLDRVARELKLDRAEVRRRNFVKPEQMPYAKPYKTRGGVPVVIDGGDYPQCQAKALAEAGWHDFPGRQAEARKQGRLLGIGVANFVELTGRGPFELATVRINTSGKIHVSSSAAAMGQSTKTMLAQIVAEQLGGDMDNIVVTTGDTATSATGFGGFGSRQTVMAGSSAHVAALRVREKALALAGQMLEVSEQDLEIVGGYIRVRGAGAVRVTLAQVAKAAMGIAGVPLYGGLPPGMESTEHFTKNEMTYSNGTEVATVEVDQDTGAVTILDIVVAHDCGKVINPTIVEGQLFGGIVHGVGNALFERMIFNEDGQPLTTTLAEYLLPTATEIPRMRVVHHELPTSLNPLGVKGVGEAGVLPTPAAVVSAIEDALSEYRVAIRSTPVTPSDIVAMLTVCREGPDQATGQPT